MTPLAATEAERDLLDDDGENRAVRTFLMLYGGANAVTVGQMREHMRRSGWGVDYWPDFSDRSSPTEHLTKAGAQIWIRHLFSMEAARALQQTAEPVAPEREVIIKGDLYLVRFLPDGFAEIYWKGAAPDRAPSTIPPVMLTAEQCDEFRRHPGTFNDMVQAIYSAGYQRVFGMLREAQAECWKRGARISELESARAPSTDSAADDTKRLDWLAAQCTGASDSDRYLPFKIYWGKKGTTKGIRYVIDKAIAASLPQTKEE